MKETLVNIREMMFKHHLDAVIIKSKANKIYLNALTGSGVWVLITKVKTYAFLDGRYTDEATKKMSDFDVIKVVDQGMYLDEIIEELIYNGFSRIGFEDSAFSIEEYLKLTRTFPKAFFLGNAIEQIRAIKTMTEIQKMKEVAAITDRSFQRLLPKIKAGLTEKQVVGKLYDIIFDEGADGMSFEPIVASGIRGAMPHGRASTKKICTNQMITIDFGLILNGYQSDMTRTVSLGEPSKKMREIYTIVQRTQEDAIQQIKEDAYASDIHNFAFNSIKAAGYQDYFNHGLGHGMGIGTGEIPILSTRSKHVLKSGMIMSCEPGIYVPNIGGVRIEDSVLVTPKGREVLNHTTKELIIL